jgi:glycosyltransferase involved in cell wall biosynthesis
MRIAILWTGLSGYLNACLKELAGHEAVELFVSHMVPNEDAPFDDKQFSWITNRLQWRSGANLVELETRLQTFHPDILLFAGWAVPEYRHMARILAKQCWRVMSMDNCWLASPKQWVGRLISRYYLLPLADAVWLPGERQATFARKLGFEQAAILRGLYSCDQPSIERVHLSRVNAGWSVQRSFLFVGRLVLDKGVDTLVTAYQAYRNSTVDPWPLVCCGEGPLRHLLEGRPGISVEGFVQPDLLASKLAAAGCLILPSGFEPWGIVIHEAASAGLLIIASENVGAAVHMVQDNFNGFIFDDRDATSLAGLMKRISTMSEVRLDAMSKASHLLSKQFSPARWADTLIETFYSLPQISALAEYAL